MGAKKIYIAEDEADVRLLIKAFLANAGYMVKVFETGDKLMEAFEENPADMVVLDVMMPGLNGFAVCKKLRKISEVPIVMLTARDSDLDYATGLDLGCNEYLVKPFSPVVFTQRVTTIFKESDNAVQ